MSPNKTLSNYKIYNNRHIPYFLICDKGLVSISSQVLHITKRIKDLFHVFRLNEKAGSDTQRTCRGMRTFDVSARLSMQKSDSPVNIYFLFCVQLPTTDRGDGDCMERGENRTRLNSFTAPPPFVSSTVLTSFSRPSLLLLSLSLSFSSGGPKPLLHFPPSIHLALIKASNANLTGRSCSSFLKKLIQDIGILKRGSSLRVIFFLQLCFVVNWTTKLESLQNYYSLIT